MSTAKSAPDDVDPKMEDHIDKPAFEQVLDMDDDDEDREFSKSIISGFFEQATEAFANMDVALKEKDLKKLSELGHFIKGSSATIGYKNVHNNCQIIQLYGNKESPEGGKDVDEEVCLKKIGEAIEDAKDNVEKVRILMENFYEMKL